jgi:hypothetical protein
LLRRRCAPQEAECAAGMEFDVRHRKIRCRRPSNAGSTPWSENCSCEQYIPIYARDKPEVSLNQKAWHAVPLKVSARTASSAVKLRRRIPTCCGCNPLLRYNPGEATTCVAFSVVSRWKKDERSANQCGARVRRDEKPGPPESPAATAEGATGCCFPDRSS